MSAEVDAPARVSRRRVSRHGKRQHLSYESSSRFNATRVYPVQSQYGHEIIVNGSDEGLYILWRGGKPLKSSDDFDDYNESVSISTHAEGSSEPLITEDVLPEDRPEFEELEEEVDDTQPYPSFVQEVKLSLGSPALHIAVPSIPTLSAYHHNARIPLILLRRLCVVVACADGSVRLITLPLEPPSEATKRKGRLAAQVCVLAPPGLGVPTITQGITLTWTGDADSQADSDEIENAINMAATMRTLEVTVDLHLDLLIALSSYTTSASLQFYRVPVVWNGWDGGSIASEAQPFRTLPLASAASSVAFNTALYPSPKHSRLSVTDMKGTLRVYDVFGSRATGGRPSSRGSGQSDALAAGSWIASFSTAFLMPKDATLPHANLARRRKILDAVWVSSGRSILALLDDGEWGVWDVDASVARPNSQRNATGSPNFVIHGFVGETASHGAQTASDPKARTSSRLAPMTPNTRKVRQESLFSGSRSSVAGQAPHGGISVVASTTTNGAPDDSIVIWYGADTYYMHSLALLWKQSISSSGRDIGSLYGPGLTRLEGINLSGERVSDMAQFPAKTTVLSIGNMIQRDIWITGEYKFVIITPLRPTTPARSLFAKPEPSLSNKAHDQQLLGKGELDLDGVERVLHGMTGVEATNGFPKAKKVGFAR